MQEGLKRCQEGHIPKDAKKGTSGSALQQMDTSGRMMEGNKRCQEGHIIKDAKKGTTGICQGGAKDAKKGTSHNMPGKAFQEDASSNRHTSKDAKKGTTGI